MNSFGINSEKNATVNGSINKDGFGTTTGLMNLGTVDFTFQNGVEYIYMGNDCFYDLNVPFLGTLLLHVLEQNSFMLLPLKTVV